MWVSSLKVAGLIAVFDAASLSAFDLAKSMFSRATEWILVGLLAVALIKFGTGIVPRTRLHFAVAAVLLANLVASVFAADTYTALYGASSRYLGLTFVIDMTVLYLAIAIAVRTRSDWFILGVCAAAGALIAVLYAFVQRAGLDPLRWATESKTRPFATIGNPDTLGHFLSVVFALLLGAFAFASGAIARYVRVASALAACAILILIATVATRGSLVGVGAAVVTLPVALVARRRLGGKRLAMTIGGIALLSLLGGALLLTTPLGERVVATFRGNEVQDRLTIYASALTAFREHPLVGVGPDSLGVVFPQYRETRYPLIFGPGKYENSAHSWIIEALATTGVLGTAALITLIIVFSIALLRRTRSDAVAGALLIATGAYWANALVSVGSIAVDWVPWVAYGGAVALSPAADGNVQPHQRPKRVPWRWAVLAGCVLLGVVVTFPVAAANRSALTADFAIDQRQSDAAVKAARSTIQGDSGRASYWNTLGLAYDIRQGWKDSGDAYAEGARRAPYNPTLWANLARSRARQALAGDQSARDPAILAATKAAALDPNEPSVLAVLAEVGIALGKPDIALPAAVRALTIWTSDQHYDDLARSAADAASDQSAARTQLELALKTKDTPTLRVALGTTCLRLGDRACARTNAARALEEAPGYVDAIALLTASGG